MFLRLGLFIIIIYGTIRSGTEQYKQSKKKKKNFLSVPLGHSSLAKLQLTVWLLAFADNTATKTNDSRIKTNYGRRKKLQNSKLLKKEKMMWQSLWQFSHQQELYLCGWQHFQYCGCYCNLKEHVGDGKVNLPLCQLKPVYNNFKNPLGWVPS